MVTIGPLVVLGVLAATFHVGARLVTSREAGVLTFPQAPTVSQPDNNLFTTMELLTPTPALSRSRTSEISTEEFSRVTEAPRFGSNIHRDRSSGGSGDSIALPRGKIRTSRAGASVGQHRPAGREPQLSAISSPSASLKDATANSQDSAMGDTTRDEAGSSAPPVPERSSLGNPQRSAHGVFGICAGNEADPEQVTTKPHMSRRDCLSLNRTLLLFRLLVGKKHCQRKWAYTPLETKVGPRPF